MASGIRQKKALSQVFLVDDGPCRSVARYVLEQGGVERVLEIGPGEGILTGCLLDAGLGVVAVEKDERFAKHVSRKFETDALRVVVGDFLEQDLGDDSFGEFQAIVGNIPYNVSSAIALKIVEMVSELRLSVLLTQLEFAQRLASKSGSKSYGSLSVYAQLRAKMTMLDVVPKELFRPQPKVDSALISFEPLDETRFSDRDLRGAEVLAKAGFAQRRKKLRNSLKAFLPKEGELDFDLERRPETLEPAEFVDLARIVFAR